MKRIHVLHTIETSGPGGAESVLLSLVKGLDPERFRSTVLLNDGGWLEDSLRQCGADVVRVGWRSWWDTKLPRAMARVIREGEVDVVHSHLPDQNFYACLAGRLTGCPVLVTYHGPVELRDAHRVRGRLKLRVVRATAAKVTVVCDFVRQMMRDVGFPDSQLHRVYNGISTEKFRKAATGALREELRLPKDALFVGMVGNVRGPKGQEYFIRAAHRLAARIPNAHFVISGDLHPTLAPPLFALVEELGVSSKVHFLGFRADVPRVLADLDVFVLPSTSEGFPLVVLEAMAAGRAVVATRCGGAEEMLAAPGVGCLVPVADDQAIANAVAALLCDAPLRQRMGRAAMEHCERHFSIGAMIAQYEALYRQSVAQPSAAEKLVEALSERGHG